MGLYKTVSRLEKEERVDALVMGKREKRESGMIFKFFGLRAPL